MAAPQVQLHRYGVFRRSDGTCAHFGSIAWAGSPALPIPQTGASPKGAAEDFYIVSMDDDVDHWLRLAAEDITPQGAVEHLRHAGGAPHPEHAHLHLGGTFTWDAAAHPHVQEIHRHVAAHPLGDLIAHAHGPTFTGHIT